MKHMYPDAACIISVMLVLLGLLLLYLSQKLT